jgi:hypothetical protein
MAENVLKLKKQALALGMPKAEVMKAARPALEDFIASASENGEQAKVAKKKTPTKAQKKAVVSRAVKKKQTAKAAPARKRKAAPKKASSSNGDLGRANIGSIDFRATSDDWNPRKGGPVERLFKALKTSRGDVDKAFDLLKGDVWDFVGRKMRDGSRRNQASAHNMLRYRLNRTLWEFATRTGQHQSSENHVQYGTGVYAKPASQGGRKRSPAKRGQVERKRTPAAKRTPKRTPAKRTAKRQTAKRTTTKRGASAPRIGQKKARR